MLSRVSAFALVGAAAASHYEKPPCQSDEIAGQVGSGAQLCAPKCDASGSCPADVPAGVKATPQCALKTTTGDKYCALVCRADTECPTSGKCTKPMPFLPTGVCTYAAGDLKASLEGPERLFEEFAATVGRIYMTAEERLARFAIFKENVVQIKHMQQMDPDAQYTHTSPFADWTVEEFAARSSLQSHLFPSVPDAPLKNVTDLPTAFDWREKGAVNAVKNQEQCGSCWAFSTVANIEGVNFLANNKLLSLSEQQLVDCDHNGDQGCSGGLPSNAFQFLINGKIGLESESAYPYTAQNGKCSESQSKELAFISSWTKISPDENQMAAALIQHGPLSIGINAGPMQWYGGGVADPLSSLCNPKQLDHGVAIVGFGVDKKNYWTIRNSWGASWGEKGYYRIVRGRNACGLTSMVTTAVIQKSTQEVVV